MGSYSWLELGFFSSRNCIHGVSSANSVINLMVQQTAYWLHAKCTWLKRGLKYIILGIKIYNHFCGQIRRLMRWQWSKAVVDTFQAKRGSIRHFKHRLDMFHLEFPFVIRMCFSCQGPSINQYRANIEPTKIKPTKVNPVRKREKKNTAKRTLKKEHWKKEHWKKRKPTIAKDTALSLRTLLLWPSHPSSSSMSASNQIQPAHLLTRQWI